MKEVKIYEPVYDTNISYLVGMEVPELITFIKERHGNAPMFSFGKRFRWGKQAHYTNAYQFHVSVPLGKGEIFYVWVHETTAYLLFHETFHLVGDILHDRGLKYSMKSEEAYAYLGGWIFSEVFKLLRGTFRKR